MRPVIHFSEFPENFSCELKCYEGHSRCGMPAGRRYAKVPVADRPGWVKSELLPKEVQLESGRITWVTDNPRKVTCKLCRRNLWPRNPYYHGWEEQWYHINETLPAEFLRKDTAWEDLLSKINGPLRTLLDTSVPSWRILRNIEEITLLKAAFDAGRKAAKKKKKKV
jgi:hypothetical protein